MIEAHDMVLIYVILFLVVYWVFNLPKDDE